MDLLCRLDQARSEINVLEHPFYQRWSAGELSAEELGCYAGEYRHAVVALAHASAQAAGEAPAAHRAQLLEHAKEEAEHVGMWGRFASAAQAGGAEGGLEGALADTRECAQAWTAGGDLLEHLAVLYAIEAGQPEISQTKLDGLVAHYGYSEGGEAVEYFRVHAVRDGAHAAEARGMIETLIARRRDARQLADRMVARARAALEGNWRLLDGVGAAVAAKAPAGPAGAVA